MLNSLGMPLPSPASAPGSSACGWPRKRGRSGPALPSRRGCSMPRSPARDARAVLRLCCRVTVAAGSRTTDSALRRCPCWPSNAVSTKRAASEIVGRGRTRRAFPERHALARHDQQQVKQLGAVRRPTPQRRFASASVVCGVGIGCKRQSTRQRATQHVGPTLPMLRRPRVPETAWSRGRAPGQVNCRATECQKRL